VTRVRKIDVGSQIGAGLSGYIASLAQSILCAEYGLPNELHDSHASYIDHWLNIMRGDKTAILHAAAKAEQAVQWLRQFDPALADPERKAA